MNTLSAMKEHYECSADADTTGPYIPISECITGERAQDEHRAFTFDPKNIVMSTRTPFDRVSDNRAHQMYLSQSHIRLNNTDFSENDSNMSDDECKSLNASQSNIRDWSVAKSFTKLAINPKNNGFPEDGPPVPPRPPKTFAMSKEFQKDACYQGPKIQEPLELQENVSPFPWFRRKSHGAPPSPGRSLHAPAAMRTTDDEEDYSPGHLSMQYCNLPSLPPAVDRALKPRHSSHSIGHINNFIGRGGLQVYHDDMKADALQYLDLDLHTSKPVAAKPQELHYKKMDVSHGKSLSTADADSAYKTVDFLKTEAFNITRRDAEASRSVKPLDHH